MPHENWTFFQAFLKSPRVVASVIPSSPFLVRRIVKAADPVSARVVVELGGGTGGTTRAMLKAMNPQAKMLVIERTAEFIDTLGGIDDPRLEVVHGCASGIGAELERRRLPPADVVISGIPFSTMQPDLCEDIVTAVNEALAPGGRFVAYQFTDRVADYAKPMMGAPDVEYELVNVPPLRLFIWRKGGNGQGKGNGNGVGID
jgi:phospholipid N-methyltransferase